MSFYRSDQMECYRLVMPRESAWETINTLGRIGLNQENMGSFTLFLIKVCKLPEFTPRRSKCVMRVYLTSKV